MSLAVLVGVKVAILLNARAGQLNRARCEQQAHELRERCARRGVRAETYMIEGKHLSATARELARTASHDGIEAIVAAGGDGTVSAVAAGIAGSEIPLGVIPLGTLNHFARDLGITSIDSALDAIAAGATESIDVGEVNGRVFVNNSSIGLYPEMVVARDAERRRHGRRKWTAMARAAIRTLLRFPLLHVAIALAGNVMSAHTPIVFVGNNEYERDVRALGSRRRLDRGRLAVYTIRATRRLHMFWVLLRALLRRSDPADFEAHAVDRADILTSKRSVRVALDGEVVHMTPPLLYRTRPGALRVLAPVSS
jgi:diacylglycerol kinase family enzyme